MTERRLDVVIDGSGPSDWRIPRLRDELKVLAVQGTMTFLIDAGRGDALGQIDVPLGRVFDFSSPTLGDALPVSSIAARGYWEDPETAKPAVAAYVRERVAELL